MKTTDVLFSPNLTICEVSEANYFKEFHALTIGGVPKKNEVVSLIVKWMVVDSHSGNMECIKKNACLCLNIKT